MLGHHMPAIVLAVLFFLLYFLFLFLLLIWGSIIRYGGVDLGVLKSEYDWGHDVKFPNSH